MSDRLEFEAISLDYGCHHERFRLAGKDGPTVIVGSNGSGKSTLVEAIVRTLFGFNRQRPAERLQQEQRRPWKGGRFRAGLALRDGEGRLSFEREFDSNAVVVIRPSSGEELYRGEANPAAPTSGDQRRFGKLLRELFGLVELGGYERTACIQQGHMLETRLAEDLLKIAAGGHVDVEKAREAVSGRYRELTLAPILPHERKRRKPGRLEELEAKLEQLDEELRVARHAEAERAPLLHELRELESCLDASWSDVRRLEEERDGLSRLRVLEEQAEASGERIRRLEGAQQDLREAIWKAEEASARIDGLPGRDAYPDDYLERLAALEEGLWPRLAALERGRTAELSAGREDRVARTDGRGPWTIVAGLGLAVGGGLAGFLATGGWSIAGILIAAVGLGLVGFGLRRSHARGARAPEAESALDRLEADLESVRERIEAKLDGLPDRDGLSAGTLSERRAAFATWRSAWEGVQRGDRRAAEARLRAMRALGVDADQRDVAVAEGPNVADAARTLSELESAVSSERNDVLAPTLLALERERAAGDSLPEDVGAAFREVDTRLLEARDALAARQQRESELRRRLGDLPRPAESSVALHERRELLERRAEEARVEARAYREGYRLLVDAYEEFRETDQERLVEHVDRQLASIGGGRLGPLAVSDDLESARLLYKGRPLELSSPPLSYGELHVALFAVRLGAADFLSGIGVRLPLLVDDPFVHLDAEHAAETWEALRSVARERQVIVTTQDRLVLEHLGLRADLDLDGTDRPTTAQIELPVSGL